MPTSMIMRWYPQLLNQEVDGAGLNPVLPTMEQFNAPIGDGRWRELSPVGHIDDPPVAAPDSGEPYAPEAGDLTAATAPLLSSGK